MKRTTLIKHIQHYDCRKLKEGSRHTQYWNPNNRRTSSIPRHTEISNLLAE
ncbi:MAG: addiction module toxin, HicA family [Calditrichaeota bacterium]|nr:addiction module toxin, HicA family [Calditrichota bacterium]